MISSWEPVTQNYYHLAMEVEVLVNDIKKKYLSAGHKAQGPEWCLKEIATLELVERFRGEGNGFEDEVRLTYDNLFRPGWHEAKRVGSKVFLVEGEAGMGKTTLCTSVTHDWACGKFFQEFFIMLLLPLRERNVVSVQSFSKLLWRLYDFSKETCDHIDNYLQTNREKVLIIADGWDELQCHDLKGSFLYRLLFDNNSSVTVMITSRPVSVPADTLPFIQRFITVKGFGKNAIEYCISSEFGSNVKGIRYLAEQMEANPLVKSMCSVPINLAMICNFCSSQAKLNVPLPNSMTDLYTDICWSIAAVSIEKNRSCKSLSSYLDLPLELQQSWLLLCEIAFRNIANQQSEASNILSSQVEMVSSFGFLKPLSKSEDGGFLFSFLHPTLEEYLAAQHLSRQSQATQLKFIQSCVKQSGRNLTNFWRFFLRNCTSGHLNAHADIMLQTIQMLSKMNHSENDQHLCHYAFEAKNIAVTREVVKNLGSTIVSSKPENDVLQFHAHTAHDCNAMMYVMDELEQKFSVEINFEACHLNFRHISRLRSILECKSKTVLIKGLDLSCNVLDDAIMADFFHQATVALSSLEKLFLRSCGIGAKTMNAVMETLAKSTSPSLMQLDLSYNPISKSCLQNLKYHIESYNTLKNLEILLLKGSLMDDISVSFLVSFTSALSLYCKNLRRMDLSDNYLGEPGSPDLNNMITELTGITMNFNLCLNEEYMFEVDERFFHSMEESIKNKGTLDYTIAHGVIVGPGRSGKDTLMHRLMGSGPPDSDYISPSTGVLENVTKVEVQKVSTVATAVTNIKWQKLEYDEEALELMMTTAKYYSVCNASLNAVSKPKPNKFIVSVNDINTSNPCSCSTRQQTKQDSLVSKIFNTVGSNSGCMNQGEETRKSAIVYSSEIAPVELFKRAVKLGRMNGLREHLESSWAFYLTNTGGQVEFQEHLPLLVSGPSIFLITFPLHHDLNKTYDMEYQQKDGNKIQLGKSRATLKEELLQILATISALDYTSCQQHDTMPDIKPKVFIIGTHKDCLPEDDAEERIKAIDKELHKCVKSTSLYKHSIQLSQPAQRAQPAQLIYAINNLSEDECDFQKIRSDIQRLVERKCISQFTVKCPSSWLVFSLILRAKYKSIQVISFEECFKVAIQCGISTHCELKHALSFIHSRLGLIRYYDVEELDTHIVIDPQILFNTLTDLLYNRITSDIAEGSQIEEFYEKGILPVAVVDRITKESIGLQLLPVKWMTKLLNVLRIAAFFRDVEDGRPVDKYFFPLAICRAPEPPSHQASPSGLVPPLLIGFESGFCPRGIPGALIKYLMTNEMKSSCPWHLLSDRVFRNQVSFSIHAHGEITLKILPTHMDVTLDPGIDYSKEELNEICKETYTQIKEGMKSITSQYIKCKYYFGFYCTFSKCGTPVHAAQLEWRGNGCCMLHCVSTQRHGRPPSGYEIWGIQKKVLGAAQLNNMIDFDNNGVDRHLGLIADFMDQWDRRITDELELTEADIADVSAKKQNSGLKEKW